MLGSLGGDGKGADAANTGRPGRRHSGFGPKTEKTGRKTNVRFVTAARTHSTKLNNLLFIFSTSHLEMIPNTSSTSVDSPYGESELSDWEKKRGGTGGNWREFYDLDARNGEQATIKFKVFFNNIPGKTTATF